LEYVAEIVSQLVALAIFLGAAIGLNFASVDGVKYLVSLLSDAVSSVSWLQKPLGYISLKGKKTFIFSIVVAAIYIMGFDVDFLGDFSAFDGIDPMYAKLAQAAIVTLGSNFVNDMQKRTEETHQAQRDLDDAYRQKAMTQVE